MPDYTNTDNRRRTWVTLTDPATDRTLSLDPGETVHLACTVDDPYLHLAKGSNSPVRAVPTSEAAPSPAPTPEPVEPAAAPGPDSTVDRPTREKK